MKHVLLFGLMLASLLSYSQYPASGVKQRLGWQTTGDGLVYRGAIADTATINPGGLNNAWMLLDTVNGNLYAYREHWWQLVSGGGGLTMPFDAVTFNVNNTDAAERELKYSDERAQLQYGGLDGVQIPLLPGIWYVRNDTSVTIPKGKVVRATGTLGASGRIKVKHMIANGSISAMYVLGIAMQDIAVGADGYVMTQGKIRQVNTTAYSNNAVLYADVDTLGGLTQTEPGNGYLKLPIAFVVHSASNGTLAVRIDPGSSLHDLHDVDTDGRVDGSVLRYDSTAGYWKASTTAGIVAGDTAAMLTNYINVADTAAMLTNYINVADTATMLSSYISNADTSVFARDWQIAGTTNRLAKFTGTSSLGDSPIVLTGDELITFGVSAPGLVTINTKDFPNTPGQMPYTKFKLNTGYGINGISMGDPSGPSYGTLTALQFTTYDGTASGGFDYWSTRLTGDGFGNFHISNSPANSDGDTVMTNRLSITAAGKVGINKTAPDSTLDVVGSSYITGNMLLNGRLGVGAQNQRHKAYFYGTGNGYAIPDTGVYILNNSSSTSPNVGLAVRQLSPGWETSNTGISGYASGWYNDIIGVLGKARIGDLNSIATTAIGIRGEVDTATYTSNPGSFLSTTIAGYFKNNMRRGGNHYGVFIQTDSAGDYGIYQTGFGVNYLASKLGIGTTSPARTLHVSATDAVRIPVGTAVQRGTGANGDVRFNSDSTVLEFYDGTGWRKPIVTNRGNGKGVANSFLKFDAAGFADTSAVLIQNGNKIGIGTASPDSTLTVNGAIRATILAVRNASPSQVMAINNYAASGSNGNNVWIGNGGQKVSGTGSQGSSNVGIGIGALLNNTTGAGNTAIGLNAMLTNNTGSNNMALGGTALNKNTSGYVNVAIGNQSLQENTTGYSNLAIGYAALNKNTEGQYNNAIGSNALSLNTLGSDNTGIGGGSLENNLTGGSNVAIGRSAMYSNTTASYNDVIGNQALYSANSEGNQAIGFRALYALTSGSYNIGIGFEAGRYTSTGGANQTSTQSIYIGTDSRASLNGNTREIVIGYGARGNGSYTTTIGNSSTTATYIPAGKMYIGGTTSPGATLHVNGSLSRNAPVTVTDATHTVAETTSWLICNRAGTVTLTLPTASSWTGREIMVKTIQAQTVISNATNISPLDGGALTTAILPATDGAWATLVSDGTNWIIMQRGS